jgi:hypothetical protein
MFHILDAHGYPTKLVESHPEITTVGAACAFLRQWMERGDRLEILEERTIKGRNVTPILIVSRDGEDMDIFGHLVR